ncbi:MAG: hypothetical protein NC485_14455 [Ruminococcus flavefaciens]|nr:hypothetical protein [Ruminococcus flavefaciens]
MNKSNNSVNKNLDKKFVDNLLSVLNQQGSKVNAQYLCSAPAPVKIKTN